MKNFYSAVLPMKGLLALWILIVISIPTFAQKDCSTATSLGTISSGCSAIGGNLRTMGPTSTAVPAGCGNNSAYNEWFSFTATNPYPTITIGSIGTNLRSAIPVIQILTGNCGSLTSVGCITGNSSSSSMTIYAGQLVPGGLTVGTTYYIRVYSNSATVATGSGWTFSVCVANPSSTAGVDYGKSYVNITKGTVGGTVEPGDILEIRATFVVNAGAVYSAAYTDNIPSGTTYVPGTLRILTNEGKIYNQSTDVMDGDGGSISGSAVTINMGAGASGTNGGYIANTSKPNFYGGTSISVASFRVQVTAAYGSVVNVGNGTFNFYNGSAAKSINFPSYNIMVFKNYGICSSGQAGGNALINEFGGTFGSGNIKDRAPSSKVPSNYTYAAFSSALGKPNDYYYCVSNNTSGGTTPSTGYATSNTAYPIPDNGSPDHRIFGVWDIIGDHTGASNPLLGNTPADTYNGNSGGYMVVINSSYRTDTAFLDTVYNLCPNTYYQYTAWFRNICSHCGCDSNGVGAGSSGYIPTAPGDSSGVYPNLTFNINGYDYYTTGNMLHTGQWIQKGFTYLTGPSQTTMIISIRNNAPGGGGNDWAIDDIGVATCSPNMLLTPNKPDTLCQGADDTVRFKITSFFPNYTEWKLEKSSDGGSTWSSVGTDTTGAGPTGSGTPVYNSTDGLYEYLVTRYFRLQPVDNTIIYRITVASTPANLSNGSCYYITSSPKIVRAVNCLIVLPTTLINFKGQLKDGLGALQWASTDETGDVGFIVESSSDGINFSPIGSLKGTAPAGQGATYQFTDPNPVTGQRYYRVRINAGPVSQYSGQVLLSNTGFDFAIRSVVNPFVDHINVDLTNPGDGTLKIALVDMYGRVVRREQQSVTQGLNTISIYGLGGLAAGTYVLQLQNGDKQLSTKMLKVAQK